MFFHFEKTHNRESGEIQFHTLNHSGAVPAAVNPFKTFLIILRHWFRIQQFVLIDSGKAIKNEDEPEDLPNVTQLPELRDKVLRGDHSIAGFEYFSFFRFSACFFIE